MNNNTQYLGEHLVKITNWNPAFALVDLKFVNSGEEVCDIHTSEEAHNKLWELIKESPDTIKEEENFWLATVSELENSIYYGGPNHCGLELGELKWRPKGRPFPPEENTLPQKKNKIPIKYYLLVILLSVPLSFAGMVFSWPTWIIPFLVLMDFVLLYKFLVNLYSL